MALPSDPSRTRLWRGVLLALALALTAAVSEPRAGFRLRRAEGLSYYTWMILADAALESRQLATAEELLRKGRITGGRANE